MNQILITEKLYVTPELKRKKKIYQLIFIVSMICVFLLSSYYIYGEYDRAVSEEYSQEILASMEDNTTIPEEDASIAIIEDNEEIQTETISQPSTNETNSYTTSNGATYKTEAVLNIPKLGINYPILSETSEELLKISLNKFWGPEPNAVGNYCIVGHNYANKKMFGKLSSIKNGDIVELTNSSTGELVKYKVYNKFVVDPSNTDCTSQRTNDKREVTLITCTNYGKQRLVVKARETK